MKLKMYGTMEELSDKIYLKRYYTKTGKPNFVNDTFKAMVQEAFTNIYNKFQGNSYIDLDKLKEDREKFLNQEFSEKIDGVTLIGDSEASLNELVSFYEGCKLKSRDDENAKQLFNNLGDNDCIVTRVSPMYDTSSSYASYIDKRFAPFIYIDNDMIFNNDYNGFVHELGHFYDKSKSYIKITNLVKKMDLDLDRMHQYLTGLSKTGNEMCKLINAEINKSDGLSKLLDSNDKSNHASILASKYKKSILSSTIYSEILSKSGDSYISDIIEAVYSLKEVDYDEKIFEFGHGKNYYKNKSHCASEIFADFTTLYNTGNDKKLDQIFPQEFRDGLTEIYINTIMGDNKGNISKIGNNTK